MLKRLTGLLIILLLSGPTLLAQQLELEKTYKISRASKRGYLAGLDYDQDAKTYTLTYFTDQKKNTFKYEQYVFDNDFNLIKDGEFTEEAEKMKKKFKWFKFKGDEYTVMGNTVDNNLTGTLVIKRKQIHYKYQFLLGGYSRNVDILEKVKPKTDDGNKMTLITHAEDDMTGDLFVLGSVKAKIAAKGNEDVGSIRLMKFNSELDLKANTDFEFPYGQSLAFSRYLEKLNPDDPESPGISGIVFIFAPSNQLGKAKSDPDNNNYTYVRVDEQGKIVERFNFKSPASYWKIQEMLVTEQGLFFYGPALAGRDKYFNEGEGNRLGGGEMKYKAVQLMKVTNGKMVYLTETNLEEFKAKQVFPPSQKKTPDYTGREFGVNSYSFASNGDLIVVGQNYDRDNKTGMIKKYEDILGFHFDKNGKLKAQYGLDTKEKGVLVDYNYLNSGGYTTVTITTKIFGCPQTMIEGSDGNVYWILREVKDFAKGKLLTYPRIGKIQMKDNTLTDLNTFGKGEGFYLDPKYPFLETDKSETLVFFGADKAGKELWFARVKLK
jgi:hypothetical protein